jgi:nucleotide-binding universal stress UspA family protein
VDDIACEIRSADLAVLGLGNPDSSVPDAQGFRPDDVIVACGRPVLGIPIANLPQEIGRNVLLAWDGSRGASRAMNDALPLLADAASVTVLSVEPDEPARRSAQSAAAHLRRHGVAAEAREIASAGMAIGDVVLAYCEHLRADLVVAGAFGHSRLRESVVGGVSRTLLHQMMVPVLMSH